MYDNVRLDVLNRAVQGSRERKFERARPRARGASRGGGRADALAAAGLVAPGDSDTAGQRDFNGAGNRVAVPAGGRFAPEFGDGGFVVDWTHLSGSL